MVEQRIFQKKKKENRKKKKEEEEEEYLDKCVDYNA